MLILRLQSDSDAHQRNIRTRLCAFSNIFLMPLFGSWRIAHSPLPIERPTFRDRDSQHRPPCPSQGNQSRVEVADASRDLLDLKPHAELCAEPQQGARHKPPHPPFICSTCATKPACSPQHGLYSRLLKISLPDISPP